MVKFRAGLNWKPALVYQELSLSTFSVSFSSWSLWLSGSSAWSDWVNSIEMLVTLRLVVRPSHCQCWAEPPDLLCRSHPLRAQRPLSLPDVDGPGSSGQPVPSQRHTGLRGCGDTQVRNISQHFIHKYKILSYQICCQVSGLVWRENPNTDRSW